MGCGSANNASYISMSLDKIHFLACCKIFKDFIIHYKKCKSITLSCYIISKTSISGFISLIERYKILDNLENNIYIDDNDFYKYEIDKNIKLISNFEQCKEFISINKNGNDEFIIVDNKFLKIMKIINPNESVDLYVDNIKNIKQIKFLDNPPIDIIETKNGIFQFLPIDISSIKKCSSYYINIDPYKSNPNVSYYNEINNLNNTWEELMKHEIIKKDNKIYLEINKNNGNQNILNLLGSLSN